MVTESEISGAETIDDSLLSTQAAELADDFFEGPEKTLVVEFTRPGKHSSLRSVDESTWSALLAKAQCTILSNVETAVKQKQGCTAYLLSESSLFVYDRRVVLKTCGRTTPLRALPDLLALGRERAAKGAAGSVASLVYSHPAFARPDEQDELHARFSDAAAFLRKLFPAGEAHHLGPEGKGVDLFVANLLPEDAISDWVQAEVYITDLGSPERFAGAPHDQVRKFWDRLAPEKLDEYHFEPYGYSANALAKAPGFYTTVHASPQDGCSYMSCATNATLPADQLGPWLSAALELANGRHATIMLFALSPLLALTMPKTVGSWKRSALHLSEGPQFHCSVATFAPTQVAPVAIPGAVSTPDVRAAARAFLAQQSEHFDQPVMLMHLDTVEAKYRQWVKALPRVKPCYAIKCNPDPGMVTRLAQLQDAPGMDCASIAEITLALQHGVAAERIIYSNPAKQATGIVFARNAGVKLLVVDSVGEVEKIAALHPGAELVLRVQTDDVGAQCPLSNKYGCPVQDCPQVLEAAKDLGVQVSGVSFHVGSGCSARGCFTEAMRRARVVCDAGAALGFAMDLVDIGGGFPGDDTAKVPFEDMAKEIDAAVAELPPAVQVISEPGRFFAQSCGTLMAQVMTVSPVPGATGGAVRYYLNDGLYGSFNCLLYDHATVGEILVLEDTSERDVVAGTFFGPTCDGFDALFERSMPRLVPGDWLLFPEMGAYTSSASSRFNGFPGAVVHYH